MSAKSTAVDELSDSIGVALEAVVVAVVVLDLLSCIVVRERERSTAGTGRGRTEVWLVCSGERGW